MTSTTEKSLVVQRENLQKQLQEQRKHIAQQLSPGLKNSNSYPRSSTMQFLINRPSLVSGVVTELIILFTGARFFRLLSAIMALIKILRPALINAQKQLPAPKLLNTNRDSI